MQSSRQTAEAATFQSFANCYLREVSSGTRIVHRSVSGTVDAIEWPLPQQQIL